MITEQIKSTFTLSSGMVLENLRMNINEYSNFFYQLKILHTKEILDNLQNKGFIPNATTPIQCANIFCFFDLFF